MAVISTYAKIVSSNSQKRPQEVRQKIQGYKPFICTPMACQLGQLQGFLKWAWNWYLSWNLRINFMNQGREPVKFATNSTRPKYYSKQRINLCVQIIERAKNIRSTVMVRRGSPRNIYFSSWIKFTNLSPRSITSQYYDDYSSKRSIDWLGVLNRIR